MSNKYNKLDHENEFIPAYLEESLKVAQYQKTLTKELYEVYEIIIEALNQGGKILLCGNGGSASDAQHIAAELVNRFKVDREPIPSRTYHLLDNYKRQRSVHEPARGFPCFRWTEEYGGKMVIYCTFSD